MTLAATIGGSLRANVALMNVEMLDARYMHAAPMVMVGILRTSATMAERMQAFRRSRWTMAVQMT
jgi:hypothetical protein